MNPQVSVIMPVYNAEKYLKQAVESVLNQTLTDVELIAIDDGSTDKSFSILEKYAKKDPRVVILKQKNAGPGLARNKGIAKAKGEYISFLDSDDFFELDMLEKMYKKAKRQQLDIIFCRFWLYNNRTKTDEPVNFDVHIPLLPYEDVFSADSCPDVILNICITAVWSSLYRRQFIFDNRLAFSNATRVEDNLFAQCSMAMAKRISFLNEHLIHYRRFFNTSLTDKVETFWKNSFIVHNEVQQYLKEHNKYDAVKSSFMKHFLEHIRFHVVERARFPVQNMAIMETKKWLKNNDIELDDIENYTTSSTALFYKELFKKRNLISNDKNLPILPIIYIIDENDVPEVALSIQSIIENSAVKHFYEIYLFYNDLAPYLQYRLEGLSQNNVRVSCVNIVGNPYDTVNPYLKKNLDKSKWIFFFPYLLYGYDQILYAFPNTFFEKDFSVLFGADMEGERVIEYKNTKEEKVYLMNTKDWENPNKLTFEAFSKRKKKTDVFREFNLSDLFDDSTSDKFKHFTAESSLYEYVLQQSYKRSLK